MIDVDLLLVLLMLTMLVTFVGWGIVIYYMRKVFKDERSSASS